VRIWVQNLFDQNPLRLKFQTWLARCHEDTDWPFARYVLTHGLAVVQPDQRPAPYDLCNYSSVRDPDLSALAADTVADELRQGLIAVPHAWLLSQCRWVHALALVPKGGGKARIVHDFSAPDGDCLNSHIDFVSVSLPRHEDVFRVLTPGTHLAKIDLRAFFRHVPLDPADWPLVGFRWDGQIMLDTRLNFGQRNASEVADRFGALVERYIARTAEALASCHIFRVSDDWLLEARSHADCDAIWRHAMRVLEEFGFVVNRLPGKSVAPCQCLTWCGLEYDTAAMTVRLPADKLRKAADCVLRCRQAASITRRELDSLFGYLQFCSAVVFGGRAFLHGVRRLRFRPDGPPLPSAARISVSDAFRLDMDWWLANLEKLNGDRRIPIVAKARGSPTLEAFVDARGGEGGIGVFVEGAFVSLSGQQCNALYPAGHRITSPGAWAKPSSVANHWEMFALIVLLDLFGSALANSVVAVHSDSMTAVKCSRDLSAALDSPELAALTRTFLALCVDLNVLVEPAHIAGDDNVLADALSRGHMSAFAQHAQCWLRARGGESAFLSGLM
jgi:hypothetical protein